MGDGTLSERLEARLKGSNHRISGVYMGLALVFALAAVLLWSLFALAAAGFYVSSTLLRREGL